MSIQDCWKRFDRGDSLETVELRRMKSQIEKSMEFVSHRGSDESRLMYRQMVQDLHRIDSALFWRAKDKKVA